ncbi:hypothetical protein VTI74DRAFT_10665 [Chaetomium olivicolor]
MGDLLNISLTMGTPFPPANASKGSTKRWILTEFLDSGYHFACRKSQASSPSEEGCNTDAEQAPATKNTVTLRWRCDGRDSLWLCCLGGWGELDPLVDANEQSAESDCDDAGIDTCFEFDAADEINNLVEKVRVVPKTRTGLQLLPALSSSHP